MKPSPKVREIAKVLSDHFPKGYVEQCDLIEAWWLYYDQPEIILTNEAITTVDKFVELAIDLFKRRYKTS
jgi:hypothetical protein